MNLSNNIRLDFLVMLFARAIIEVAKMDDIEDAGVFRLDNKSHKTKKRIDRRIEDMSKKLDASIKAMYEIGKSKLTKWVSNTAKGRIDNTILAINDKEVNLNYLALSVLYVNFCDFRGDKNIMREMKWIKEDTDYILDTLFI